MRRRQTDCSMTARLEAGRGEYVPGWSAHGENYGILGLPATPAQIIEACYLQCERPHQRRNLMGWLGRTSSGN